LTKNKRLRKTFFKRLRARWDPIPHLFDLSRLVCQIIVFDMCASI